MALVKGFFYVANTDSVWRYPYRDGETASVDKGEKILSLPAGGYNNHWTRNLLVNADGSNLFVTVGSSSNVGENGIAEEKRRAECSGNQSRRQRRASRRIGYAQSKRLGLRAENWRAMDRGQRTRQLGDDLVPDYLTRVRDGDFYGWPWSYWGGHIDGRVKPPRPDLIAKAIAPDYALGPHVAPLGMTFYPANVFRRIIAAAYSSASTDRETAAFAGYRIVYVPFRMGSQAERRRICSPAFPARSRQRRRSGRPVGVAVDSNGALLGSPTIPATSCGAWRPRSGR